MGGKPGTSRGCGTCRRRKKGCDLMSPSCGQCLKSNLICTGYDKEIKGKQQTNFDQSDQVVAGSKPLAEHNKAGSPVRLLLLPKLPNSCERSAARTGWYGAFMQHWLPPSPASQRVEIFMRGGWILDMPKLATEDPLVACAFDALSLIRLGNLSKDQSIIQRSEVEYGKAIRVVRARLLEAERQHDPKETKMQLYKRSRSKDQAQLLVLLSAVLLLGQFEVLSASREKATGWMSHTHAALALHKQYGSPKDDKSCELFHKVRAALRTDSIIRAIGMRDPSWVIPRPKVVDLMDKLDVLSRMMEELPAILQQTEKLLQHSVKTLPSAAADLADNTAVVYAKFDAWRQTQETSVIDSGYWYEDRQPLYHQRRNENNKEAEWITRQCIWFSDLETATAYTILWSGILNLCVSHCTTMRWLASILSPSELAATSRNTTHIFSYTSPMPMLAQAQACVTNINLSLEYFLQPSVGSLTGRIISFPLALTLGWELRSPSGLVDVRTTEALQLLRERDGIPLDTFLAGLHQTAETKPGHARDLKGSQSRLA